VSRSRCLRALAAGGVLAAASISLIAAPAYAAPPPESLTILTTHPLHVTSSTGKDLLLTVGAVRFANDASQSDAHSKGNLTLTLAKPDRSESHAWTFNLAANSFTSSPGGSGHLNTGSQIAPFGKTKLTMSPSSKGVKHGCGGGNFEILHNITLKGPIRLATHSGTGGWGTVKLPGATLHGRLRGGHGPDNEEACATAPPCTTGVSWTASHGHVTLLGLDVARKGKAHHSKIVGNRFVTFSTPSGATRLDVARTTAPAPTFSTVSGHRTLSVTTSGATSTGSATLTSRGHSPYAADCKGGQEKGRLWNASYQADTTALTLTEDIFGPMTIDHSRGASFQKVHIA
jgi:hypothetical protein